MGPAKRLDHVNITVKDLEAAVAFFAVLGLAPDGPPQVVEGPWLDGTIGIDDAKTEIVMMRLPGADTTVELSRFLRPECTEQPREAPTSELGLRSIAFEVDDVHMTVERLAQDGYRLVRDVVRYGDVYALCYVRGPEGVIVMLAEKLG